MKWSEGVVENSNKKIDLEFTQGCICMCEHGHGHHGDEKYSTIVQYAVQFSGLTMMFQSTSDFLFVACYRDVLLSSFA